MESPFKGHREADFIYCVSDFEKSTFTIRFNNGNTHTGIRIQSGEICVGPINEIFTFKDIKMCTTRLDTS